MSCCYYQSLVVHAQDSSDPCALDLWVFDTIQRCNETLPPNAEGTLFANDQCQSSTDAIVGDDAESIADSDAALFPGHYRAQCTADNKIRFVESGCATDTCSSTTLDIDNGSSATTNTCDKDPSTIAALYSRYDPPEYEVQAKSNAGLTGYYTCLRLQGEGGNTVTFVVFGNCTACRLSGGGDGESPSSTPPPTDTVAPTLAGTDTWAPTPPPSTTLAPSPASPPTTTTEQPASSPTMTTAPAQAPSSATVEPTALPSSTPPVSATDAPEAPTDSETEPPMAAPTTTTTLQPSNSIVSPTNNNEAIVARAAVALWLSPMDSALEDYSTVMAHWENVTKAHIVASVSSQSSSGEGGISVSAISILITNQTIEPATGGRRRSARRRRGLSDGSSKLRIAFDLSMQFYYNAEDDAAKKSLLQLFQGAFDTEQERTAYLLKLSPLLEVGSVESGSSSDESNSNTNDGKNPPATIPGTGDSTSDTNNSQEKDTLPMLAGIAVGAAALLLLVGGFLVHKKRQQKSNSKASGMAKTHEVESPSSSGDAPPTKGGNSSNPSSSSPQRWTNEIVVDPSEDDVSTLGGSVLNGLNLVENNNNTTTHGEDEPTASVNLDYDYGRSRYRTDGDDRTRSHMTEETGPTTFTNYSKLGMNVNPVFADDMSFEQQFAEQDDDLDYINRLNRKEQGATSSINNQVKPFEVNAPPGKLGMVVDTPNGGVPVVRAIKPDSVLNGQVLIGDRLISVDFQDVTNMTALEVSSLISQKQDQERLLVFCRLAVLSPQSHLKHHAV